jgi:cytochrome c biogenesis protein CcmG/thiol:disulfide interchange protein DsbE
VLTPLLTAVVVATLQSSTLASPIAIGAPAPALNAVTPEGKVVAGGWSGAEATVVLFFATWCKPCHRTLRELELIRLAIGPRLRFVLIDAGDDPAEVRQFIVENPVPQGATVTTDLSGRDRQSWGCQIYPTLFLVDRAGVVRYINHGWGDGSQAKYLRRIRNVLGDTATNGTGKTPGVPPRATQNRPGP